MTKYFPSKLFSKLITWDIFEELQYLYKRDGIVSKQNMVYHKYHMWNIFDLDNVEQISIQKMLYSDFLDSVVQILSRNVMQCY